MVERDMGLSAVFSRDFVRCRENGPRLVSYFGTLEERNTSLCSKGLGNRRRI